MTTPESLAGRTASPPTTARPAIAITGLGAVCGCGWGIDATWAGLCSGEAAFQTPGRFDDQRHRTHLASPVPPLDPELAAAVSADLARARPATAHPGPRLQLASPRLSHTDRFALFAAAEALRMAGLLPLPADRLVGVFFGTSTAGMYEAECVYDELRASAADGGTRAVRVSPTASQSMNAPGDAVARAIGASGPVLTVSSACTSGALAIAAALDALRSGEVDIAVAGGADALCQLTFAGFNSLRAVDSQPARPFRAERAGLTLGEGAGVLVLERGESAAARGAACLALLAGAGSTCDAEHMTAPAVGGTGAARAIWQALADAGLSADAIDLINAHGTGTPLNDAAEWAAFASVLGERASAVPVTSTKGVVGHLLGAAGAIEAVVTVLSLRHGLLHPTPGEGTVDPAFFGMHLVRDAALAVPGARVGLSTSLAFGGSNAALLLLHPTRRPEPAP
jgi:3-oxoacyl-[acyl-carrier-protein] synthase II